MLRRSYCVLVITILAYASLSAMEESDEVNYLDSQQLYIYLSTEKNIKAEFVLAAIRNDMITRDDGKQKLPDYIFNNFIRRLQNNSDKEETKKCLHEMAVLLRDIVTELQAIVSLICLKNSILLPNGSDMCWKIHGMSELLKISQAVTNKTEIWKAGISSRLNAISYQKSELLKDDKYTLSHDDKLYIEAIELFIKKMKMLAYYLLSYAMHMKNAAYLAKL